MYLDKNLKFKKKILFIFLLWLISFLFLLGFNIYTHSIFEEHTMESTTEISNEGSININIYIDNIFSHLYTIASQISYKEFSEPKEIIKNFDDFISQNKLKLIAITDLNGIAYTNKGNVIDVSDRDYFKNALEGKQTLSSIVYSKVDGKSTNVFCIPIFKDTKIIAILWASILTDNLYSNFHLDTINKLGGDTFIINSEGTILASSKKMNLYSSNSNLFSSLDTTNNSKNLEILKNDFNTLTNNYLKLNSNNKDKQILYYSKLNYEDWWLISIISNEVLQNSYSYISKSITIFNLIFMFFVSGVLFILFFNEKNSFSRLQSLAYTDSITQGKNDTFIKNNLFNIINTKENFAFISLEIINIKTLINILGFKKGEVLIKDIYDYMSPLLNDGEFIIHSYLGEFKLIMKYNNPLELTNRLDALDFSKVHENIDFKMGVYLIDDHNDTFDDMCSYVTIAKESITNSKYIIYNKDLYQKEFNKFKLKDDIKCGIKNKEFKAWFQPKYSRDGKTIIGAEALVRWYKYGSIVPPYIFIPLCESTGLIKEIDELVFEDVCINLNKWIRENKNVVPISINLSRNYLDKPNFIDTLEKYINIYKIPKNLIHFEITESSLIQNEQLLKNTISILHEKGFKVLLDDFDVGYSSIKAISDANFDILKIDKSFVDGIGQEKWNNIIKFTINLSNMLGMKVVAEGIETKEQYKFLLDCNCDIFQGYYFNKPMSPEDFSKLI